MQRYFFTYGTASHFPYGINDFVEVNAKDEFSACETYRQFYPDYTPNTINCAFIYNEEQFNQIKDKYYKDVEPVDILVAERTKDEDLVEEDIEIAD